MILLKAFITEVIYSYLQNEQCTWWHTDHFFRICLTQQNLVGSWKCQPCTNFQNMLMILGSPEMRWSLCLATQQASSAQQTTWAHTYLYTYLIYTDTKYTYLTYAYILHTYITHRQIYIYVNIKIYRYKRILDFSSHRFFLF